MTEEDDASSSDFDVDHEGNEISHARRRTRRASVDLQNFQRDVVSHRATTRIPTPPYTPSAENTPAESPASSAANLSVTHSTPPPDQGSTSQPHPLSHVQPSPLPAQRDQSLLTVSGTNNDPVPCPPAPRRRISQALEDFMRALRSDVAPPQPTPSQVDTSNLVSPTLSTPSHTPLSGAPSQFSPLRSPDGSNGRAHDRRRSKNRFSFAAISDAILDSVKSHSPLASKKREGTPASLDAQDSGGNGESTRGRSREKGKGKSRDLSHALIRVSEVFRLESEEGREARDGWKEFKKGALLLLFLGIRFLTGVWSFRNLHISNIIHHSG